MTLTNTSFSRNLRILYVGMKYNYGKPEQGYSFEHYNFYDSLQRMGHNVLYFDFMSLLQEHGQESMNRRLLEVVKAEKPDLMFTVLFKDELDRKVVREISENTDTVTLNWFCDDHWRFDIYSRFWAPCFNWVVTTAQSALPKYAKIGYHNAIKSQWGCNHFLYHQLKNLPLKYDVTFVGQPHGNRRETIEVLRQAGINVYLWGSGWEAGRLSQEEMIQVFNQSRINLNLTNSFTTVPTKNPALRWISDRLDVIPTGSQVKMMGKKWLTSVKHSLPVAPAVEHSQNPVQQYPDQIKGRNFEIPGCSGFVLTGKADNLENYYQIGQEVVCFENNDDLIDKVRYYLKHDDQRAAIAQAGYERTLRDHTYAQRFAQVFEQMGLLYASQGVR